LRNSNAPAPRCGARGLEKQPAHHATEAFSLMISGTPMGLPDSVRLLRLDFDFTAPSLP